MNTLTKFLTFISLIVIVIVLVRLPPCYSILPVKGTGMKCFDTPLVRTEIKKAILLLKQADYTVTKNK